jgi:hypothetical protein
VSTVMEKTYYYTDPLAAAWMAKHFGMEFKPGNGFTYRWSDFLSTEPEEMEGVKWLVSPDCLHLLEPKIDDLVTIPLIGPGVERVGYVRYGAMHEGKPYAFARDYKGGDDNTGITVFGYRIIQRDGKPFFWPECDN